MRSFAFCDSFMPGLIHARIIPEDPDEDGVMILQHDKRSACLPILLILLILAFQFVVAICLN
jgi:hypothetical protein